MVNKRNCGIGFVLAIVLIVIVLLFNSASIDNGSVYVYEGEYDNGYYNLSVSFTPTKDMPNSRLTAQLFAEDGSLVGEMADGYFVQNNYLGGKEYDFWMQIPLKTKKQPKKLVLELSNQNDLDHLESKDIYYYTTIKNDIFDDPYSNNNDTVKNRNLSSDNTTTK